MIKKTLMWLWIGMAILFSNLSPASSHAGTEKARAFVYYVPHVAVKTGLWTGISIRNMNSEETANVVLDLYNADGTRAGHEEKTLAPRMQVSFAAGDGMDRNGWLKLVSDQPLSGLFFQGIAGRWNLLASPPLIDFLSTRLYLPHAGHDEYLDTEVFICNPNPAPTSVLLEFEDAVGQVLFSKTLLIPADGGSRYDMGELVQQTAQSRGSLAITAERGVAAYALLSNLKSGGMSYTAIPAMDISTDY